MKFTRRNVFAFLAAPLAFLVKPVLGETNPWYPDPKIIIEPPIPPLIVVEVDENKTKEKLRRLKCILTAVGKFKSHEVETIRKLIAKKDHKTLEVYKKLFVEGNKECFILFRTCSALHITSSVVIGSLQLWDIIEKSYSPDNFALLEYDFRYYDMDLFNVKEQLWELV